MICLLFVNDGKYIKSMTRYLNVSHISIFDSYKSSTDCQRNRKCKNYIQLDQLKTIKRTKSKLKRNIKMLENRNDKIPYVRVKQKNAKS